MSSLILFAISLCWDASPSPEVDRYKIYVDGVYKESVTATTATVAGLEPGKVYGFTVTAVDDETSLESEPSNELRYVLPVLSISPDLVVSFQVPDPSKQSNVEYVLESTTDFQTWRNEVYIFESETGRLYIGPPEPYRFYRVRMNIRKEGCAG
jgi:hypothetical protein